jgi:hypothetical protein
MRAVSSGTGGNGCERSDIGGLRIGTRSTPPLARTLPTSPIVSGPFYNAPAEPWCKNGRFCTVAQHVVIDLSCLRLGLRRDLPWTTIVPNDDEGELGLGHLDTLTASVPEHPNFHI